MDEVTQQTQNEKEEFSPHEGFLPIIIPFVIILTIFMGVITGHIVSDDLNESAFEIFFFNEQREEDTQEVRTLNYMEGTYEDYCDIYISTNFPVHNRLIHRNGEQ